MKQTDLEKLLADMSLKEKVDQMLQLSGAFYLGDENSVLTGPANDMGIGKEDLEMAGSILGAAGADTMKKELGITVSVGVSFNKIFAKLGSDYKKPDEIGRASCRERV